jgi:N-acetyl-anhydromuramyl-L-alanine amidase AmpD
MPDAGVCPFARWLPTKNFGYPTGQHGQNKPWFFVDHIMAGFKRTMDNLQWLDGSGISSHFAIGFDGSISQYVNIFDASYANGITGTIGEGRHGIERFDRANRHLAACEGLDGASWNFLRLGGAPYWNLCAPIEGGAVASILNCRSITTEHEGTDPSKPWTPEMLDADIRVKRWCLEELARAGHGMTVDSDLLVGHFQIDPVNRANCPGPSWPKDAILAALQTGPKPEESGDVYHQLDAQNAFLANREVAGPQAVNAFFDYKLPAEAKRVRIEFLLRSGQLRVLHGDTKADAGRVGWGVPDGQPSQGLVEVCLDSQGWFALIGGGEQPVGPASKSAAIVSARAVAWFS